MREITINEPRKVNTKNGEKFVANSVVGGESHIPNMFWDAWSDAKQELKQAGASVSKYKGEWQLSFWGETKQEVRESVEDVNEILQRGGYTTTESSNTESSTQHCHRKPNGHCSMESSADLLSFGYPAGAVIKCEECGGKIEAV